MIKDNIGLGSIYYMKFAVAAIFVFAYYYFYFTNSKVKAICDAKTGMQ